MPLISNTDIPERHHFIFKTYILEHIICYCCIATVQQQHSVNTQCGHHLGELLLLHSFGEQPQSEHLTFINITESAKVKTIHLQIELKYRIKIWNLHYYFFRIKEHQPSFVKMSSRHCSCFSGPQKLLCV